MNPYSCSLDNTSGDEELKGDLIDRRTNRTLEMEFESKTLEEHKCSTMNMFLRLDGKALTVLIPFGTTYLCESGFSTLLSINAKSRNRLNPQVGMRVALSNQAPYFDKLATKHEGQKSIELCVLWLPVCSKFQLLLFFTIFQSL